MFMLGLGPLAVVHNRTGTSFSALEIASDYWCRPNIDRLLYIRYIVSTKVLNWRKFKVLFYTVRHN